MKIKQRVNGKSDYWVLIIEAENKQEDDFVYNLYSEFERINEKLNISISNFLKNIR